MPATILIGAQWGDEGKGRVADWLSAEADVVARYAGGDNAGHTVAVGPQVYKLHLIPSGILHPRVTCVLGGGMVVNPVNLVREMEELRAQGVDVTPARLQLSTRAHLITPLHIMEDGASESALGADKIGTTLRGIGPAYSDKTGRRGLRAGDMLDVEAFGDALRTRLATLNARLQALGQPMVDVDAGVVEALNAAVYLRPFLQDTTVALNTRLAAGARVLCEGAQGTLLDIDHGSYPFVTSSSPTVGGALTGLGFGPLHVDRVVGVAKAFSTRVGGGPMPTELDGPLAERLRGTGENFWDEFGTTTGRPRRCGWLDAVLLRYAAQVNGFSELVMTKLDVLTGFDTLRIAVAYEVDGVRTDVAPPDAAALARAVPLYEDFAGWADDLGGARTANDLPAAARDYLAAVERLVGVPVRTVSVGPERDQLVHL